MAAKIFRINYKSDFILTLVSDAGWMTPFCIKFWTGVPSQAFFVGWDGTTYTHCAPVDGDPTKLLVQFDDHHLPIGDLKFQIAYHFTVADFPTSVEDEVLNQASVIIEVDDAPAQVMLDFNGETAPEIEFSLPAYANEAQRIANEQARIAAEQQRIANEDARIAAETIRQQNEAQRIAQETARVNEFATLKSQSQAATRDANDASTLANQKAQLAADKAALANDAATLANQKAQLAADKAALANDAAQLAADKAALAQQKAEYAQQQGGYAKDQGDYAKNQGDYAKEQGDTALTDHQRAEADHGIAVDDHTQAGNNHTRAESDHGIAVDDHTQAGNDHTRAESDHGIAVDDHTQAGADHTRSESDHSTASADHTQAGQDHTRAESDHTRAESDHAAVEVYVDSLGVFDLSKHNAVGGVLATYADLSEALTALNALDSKYKYGGMSFKYVQSSDNKYVQYRLMSETFNTTVANWQGVDNAPTAGSNNLIKSGGSFLGDNKIIVEAGLTIDFSFNVKRVDYPLYGLKAGQKIYVTVVQGPSDPYTSVFTFDNSGQQVEELGSGLRTIGQKYTYTLQHDADKLTFYQNGTANQLKVDVRFAGALDSLKNELKAEIDKKASISSVASLSDIVDAKADKDSVDTLYEIVESDFSSLEEITIQDERPITEDASYLLIESVKGNTNIVGSSFENMNAESIKSYDGSDDEIGEITLHVSEHYEGGMKSAGSIYDELFNGKAIQRIDVLDLGTLTWVRWGASGVVGTFAASFNKAATGGSTGNQNIKCIPYSSTKTASNIYNGTIDKAINVSSSFQGYDTIVIRDSDYSTPADFKAAMNGVLLYYQMRNYVETPANTSFLIPVVNGGKIVLQSTGSTTSMNASARFKKGVDEKLAQKADKTEVDALEIEVGKKLTENNIIAGDNITITKNGKNCTISAPSSSALPDNSVTNSKLASGSVSPEKFDNTVVPYIASQVGSQITNFPDNITIESVNNLLKLKDYAVPVNGMGYKLISSAANLTQSLAQSWANCIVEIKAALTVTDCYSIPNTAILYFNGGCFIFNENSYKINARGVRIAAEPYQIFYGEPNFNYAGGFDNPQGMIANVGYGEWFGAKGDGESFDAAAFRNLSMHVSCNEIHLLPNKTYVFESWVRIFSTLRGASNAKIVRYNGFVDIPVTSAIATQSSGKITITVDDSDDTYGALKVGMGVIFAQRPGITRDVEGSGIRYVTAIDGNQVSFGGMGVGKAFAANTASVVSAYPLIILYNSAQLIGVEIDGGLGASSAESVYPYDRTFWEYDQSIGVTYGVNAVVKDCRIYNSLADAIECGGKNTKIEHNFIMHCGSGGIHLSGIDNCEIVDNFIFDTNVNLQTGHNEGAIIYSNQIYGVFIHNNTIDNCLTGIGDMSDSENCKNIITDNVFKNFRNNGLDILIGDAGGAAFGRLLRDVIIRGNRFIGSQDNELSHEWEPTPYVARQETSGYGVAVTKASGASASDVNFKNILIDGNIFVDCGVKMENTKNGIVSNNTFESLHVFTGTHPSQMISISNAYVNIVGNILRVTSAIITKLVVASGGKVNLSNTIYEASVGLVDSGANVNEDNNISI